MTAIKYVDHEIVTKLPVKDIGLAFRDGIQSRDRGLVGMAGRILEWQFFTPEQHDDPFSELEPGDTPTFSAAASYGLREKSHRSSFGQALAAGVGGAVFLSIWDRGENREVLLRHAGDLSPASRKKVEEVVLSFIRADPQLTRSEHQGKLR